jgi:general secretion pathway protein E
LFISGKLLLLQVPETRHIQNASPDFLDFLVGKHLLDAPGLQRVRNLLVAKTDNLVTILLELGLVPETTLATAQAEFLGLDFVDEQEFPASLPEDDIIPHDYLRRTGLLPLSVTEDFVTLALPYPLDAEHALALGYFMNRNPVLKVGTVSHVRQHLQKLLNMGQGADPLASDDANGGSYQEEDVERLRDVARDAPTIKLLNRLIVAAVDRNASDIHIEPLEDQLRVRFRIDGALQDVETLSREVQAGLVSRVKILARLNIAEHRLPQDGRIRVPVRGRDIDLRVATTPILYGESVALRILDRQDVPLDFTALGFSSEAVAHLINHIQSPNGIILVTGPTGSGKTTTLYAGLNLLNRPDVKVFTVEDPIEVHMKGVNQVQVKPQIGLDFAAVLRSVLRQDPDILMIGEIRDIETARIAVQSSLTGHLVLSTLHTNSAAASVARLIDMGVEPYLLASSLKAIVAQRLVRKLCSRCSIKGPLLPAIVAKFRLPETSTCSSATGCPACHGTGYNGRTVIYEILGVSAALGDAMTRAASQSEIERIAKSEGMQTLQQCAINKVLAGETSLDEVMRVAGEVII